MPSKRKLRHSQNFIYQPELVEELLEMTNIDRNDLVVEIGPGKGTITQELLKRAGRVIAIERDTMLAAELSPLKARSNLELVVGDFLKWELPNVDYKVFSNPPFNYTADIVYKLTSYDTAPTNTYLIMQQAAAYRFAGMPYERNSQISILLGVEFTIEVMRQISRDHFRPRPNVNIVFVHFAKRTQPLISRVDLLDFRDFVIYGYNQWAPTALDAFKGVFSTRQLSIIKRTQNIEGLKPSDLTVDHWIELFGTFCQHVNQRTRNRVYGSEKRLKIQQDGLTKMHRTRKPGKK